jgi:hypothetical protein
LQEDQQHWDELMTPDWAGWPFGRNLYVAEVLSLIQRVPGVKHVLDVQLRTRPIFPSEEESRRNENEEEEEEALTPVQEKVLRVPADALLCSLPHHIHLAELDDNA